MGVLSTQTRQPTLVATEAKPVRLTCRSARGRPAARLRWAIAADADALTIVAHLVNADNPTPSDAVQQQQQQQQLGGATIRERVETDEHGFETAISNIT